jgi:hypothetical protein
MFRFPNISIIALLLAIPAFSQVENSGAVPAASGPAVEDDRMVTPPSVSDQPYSTQFASETRSNFVQGGVTFTTAYSDNVLGSTQGSAVSDVSYSIAPTLSLDRTDTRLHSVFSYSPGFTFYQHTSERNQADHNIAADLSYRLSPHVTLDVRDTFRKSSDFFNQFNPGTTNQVNGGTQTPAVAVVPPLANQLTNNGSVGLTYQFARNAMVGIGGQFNYLHYPDLTQVPGLYDSNAAAGQAYYTHRLSSRHYVGASYQYQKTLAYPVDQRSETETQTGQLFYTIFLSPTWSASVSGGAQYTNLLFTPFPLITQWSPTGSASLSWQSPHTAFVAGYSRSVSAGGGLVGAYDNSSANASLRRQLLRTWSAGLSGNYAIYKALEPGVFPGSQDGHSISGGFSVQHQLSQHVSLDAGYNYLHQSYNNVAAIAGAPDTNRAWISVSYQFSRPLGR